MGVKGFVEGGIASNVAGRTTHPFDLVKVRIQVKPTARTRIWQSMLRMQVDSRLPMA